MAVQLKDLQDKSKYRKALKEELTPLKATPSLSAATSERGSASQLVTRADSLEDAFRALERAFVGASHIG